MSRKCVKILLQLAVNTPPGSHTVLQCVFFKSSVQTTCVRLLFGQIQLCSGLQNRLDRRHSSLHPDNRIAPVTTLLIGRRRSHGAKKAGRPLRERWIMGSGVHVKWRANTRVSLVFRCFLGNFSLNKHSMYYMTSNPTVFNVLIAFKATVISVYMAITNVSMLTL